MFVRETDDFQYDLVAFFGTAGDGVIDQHRAVKSFAFRLYQPEALVACQRAHEPVAAAFNDIDDDTAVADLSIAMSFLDGTRNHCVIIHRSCGIFRADIQIAVGVRFQRDDKPESPFVGAERADHTMAHGG